MGIPIVSETEFNSVVVLQSLHPEEPPTGFTLVRDTLGPLCEKDGQRCEFREFRSRSELAEILSGIERDCSHKGWLPIVHIEAHGDDIDGLTCHPTEEIVPWRDLVSMLRRINVACANRLLVVVAACYGIDALSALADEDTINNVAPFWLLLGPEAAISAPVLEEAMQHFYSRVLSGASIIEALAEKSPPLQSALCESIFFNGMLSCLFKQHTGPGLEHRIRRLAASTIATARLDGGICDTPALLREIRMRLQPERFDLDRFKRRFLMSDHPRNQGRFSITLQQLLDELNRTLSRSKGSSSGEGRA